MGSDNRVTKSTRHSYATRSNKVQKCKTPGGRHTAHIITKKNKGTLCGDCKNPLPGIKTMKSSSVKNTKKRERRVSRAYGGSRCATCVRQRIVRAFLVEEQKIVKKMLMEKVKAKK